MMGGLKEEFERGKERRKLEGRVSRVDREWQVD